MGDGIACETGQPVAHRLASGSCGCPARADAARVPGIAPLGAAVSPSRAPGSHVASDGAGARSLSATGPSTSRALAEPGALVCAGGADDAANPGQPRSRSPEAEARGGTDPA